MFKVFFFSKLKKYFYFYIAWTDLSLYFYIKKANLKYTPIPVLKGISNLNTSRELSKIFFKTIKLCKIKKDIQTCEEESIKYIEY